MHQQPGSSATIVVAAQVHDQRVARATLRVRRKNASVHATPSKPQSNTNVVLSAQSPAKSSPVAMASARVGASPWLCGRSCNRITAKQSAAPVYVDDTL